MKEPQFATLICEKKKYPIALIHYKSAQVTLKEKEKVYNTVGISNVEFDFSSFSKDEKIAFLESFEMN